MLLPYFTHQQLLKFLNAEGWEIISDKDWETHNRLMIGKGGLSFPLQIKSYYPFSVVTELCISLEITPPPDHLTCYMQYKNYKNTQNPNPSIEEDIPKKEDNKKDEEPLL